MRHILILGCLAGAISACSPGELPTAPQSRPASLTAEAGATCSLGGSEADVLAEIATLRAQVDALEAAGALNAGQAGALRNHLDNAERALTDGHLCAARASLRAFRQQVTNFVADGVLSDAEGAPLLEGADLALGSDGAAAGMLLFQTDRDGNVEIYVMDADGSNPVNLTNNPASDFEPAWSPDGSRIAFVSSRDEYLDIFVMNADGSDPVNLTPDDLVPLTAFPETPTWSPDGSRIASSSATP